MLKYVFLCGVLVVSFALQGQAKLERAQFFFSQGDYRSAVRTIQSARNLVPSSTEATLLLAVSYYHLNELREAEKLLVSLNEDRKVAYPSAWFYLGRLYHAQHRFAEAATFYKRYLRGLASSDEARRITIDYIRMCDNGLRNTYSPEGMVVENLGQAVNSLHDEFGPVPSPTGSAKVYFSATTPEDPLAVEKSRQQSDIVFTELQGTEWSTRQPLHSYLMSPQHELLLDISADGRELYYFRGESETQGAYLVDTFQESAVKQFTTLRLEAPLNPLLGDVTPFFWSADLIYFSSSRPGGYGGLDLYKMVKNGDRWLPAENLGPSINTPYDEITPFVAKDGRTLYFSSNNPAYAVGGFDVLKTYYYAELGRYSAVQNVGLPLNSAGNDTHFRLAPDTFTAFLSSDRKDGYGGRDIYIVYFIEPRKEMEVLLTEKGDQ